MSTVQFAFTRDSSCDLGKAIRSLFATVAPYVANANCTERLWVTNCNKWSAA